MDTAGSDTIIGRDPADPQETEIRKLPLNTNKMLRTDEQTIEDLGLFGKRSGSGIFDIYNRSHTRGGEALLEEMFRHPMSDKEDINQRSSIIENFAEMGIAFPYNASLFDMAEKYLVSSEKHSKSKNDPTLLGEKEVQNGVGAVIDLIRLTKNFVEQGAIKSIVAYATEREAIAQLLADPVFEPALKEQPKGKLSYGAVTAYDALFRVSDRHKIEKLLGYIYYLDVYMSVAEIAKERNFIFPRALDKGLCELQLQNVYHPSLKHPVGNDITMNATQNVIFLTGANMAGKSTFLRSLSTALYLAHMGFPVAAKAMTFSVMDGIYTTVNLPDNLGIGASHFYAEVLRVKKMATELSSGQSFFILFDELFRGTNVKDAHEATVAVTNGFATRKNSMFIISSHIVEAGEELKKKSNIDFLYLPTRMNNHVPEYTYKLEKGITDDRHGMVIIRNEGILDILEKGKKKRAPASITHHVKPA
jgi:DNA mismatch repair protein MutS